MKFINEATYGDNYEETYTDYNSYTRTIRTNAEALAETYRDYHGCMDEGHYGLFSDYSTENYSLKGVVIA